MGRARMTNDDYYLYNAIATGDLRQAQKMLYSQVTGNGRYSENQHAEYFRHELRKFMTLEVPPALSGHLRVFAPERGSMTGCTISESMRKTSSRTSYASKTTQMP